VYPVNELQRFGYEQELTQALRFRDLLTGPASPPSNARAAPAQPGRSPARGAS
jgi:hypothetical protein